jgi:hypothetical protein
MSVERREQVTRTDWSQRASGGTRFQWKTVVFRGWHEPDESRGSRPDLWEPRGEILWGHPAAKRREEITSCEE